MNINKIHFFIRICLWAAIGFIFFQLGNTSAPYIKFRHPKISEHPIQKVTDDNCIKKTEIHPSKHTPDCRIVNNFRPTGEKWSDDCSRMIWAYSTIQCGKYRYFGWQSWNDSIDEKNVWINGNQYYRSCQWPLGIPDEELKSEDCKYDFIQKEGK